MAEGNIFLDKRAHTRILVKLPITFNVLTGKSKDLDLMEEEGNLKNAESWDTSIGGMYLISDQKLEPATQLALKIHVPQTKEHLKVLAEVVWSDGSGAGLKFIAMKEATVKALENFIKGISEKP